MIFIIEGLKVIAMTVYSFFKMIIEIFIDLTNIPTSFYELIQFFVKTDYTIFGSIILGKIVLFIVPLIVSLLITIFISKISKNKIFLSICEIALYFGLLILMPYILLIAIIIFIIGVALLIKNNNYSYR